MSIQREIVNLQQEFIFQVFRKFIHQKRGKWVKFDYFTQFNKNSY